MAIRQAVVMALKNLAVRKVRSLLTMLGIIVGVAAVIIIMTIGRGTLAQVEAQFAQMGANTISVNVFGRDPTRRISVEDMYELVSENADLLCDLSPVTALGGGVKCGSKLYPQTSVIGVSEAYPQTQLLDLTAGVFLQYMDIERSANVCVVGSFVADELLGGAALGETLKIRGHNYTVIGVLAGFGELATDEGSADDVVYIPYTNALQLGGTSFVGSFNLNSANIDCSEAAVAAIEARLLACYENEDLYRVSSRREQIEMMAAMQNSMLSVLSTIAGIALLVGGVGIMNIMSISVSERIKEIGVRKSFGARRRDIRLQFIIEATCTGMIGGIFGVLFGLAAAVAACRFMQLPFTLALDAVALSMSFSVGIGIVFGFLPANKAAKLEPVEALRREG